MLNAADRQLLESQGVDAAQQKRLDELGLADLFVGALRGNAVTCRAVSCKFNKRGKCTVPPAQLTLNRLWECVNYRSKRSTK